MSTLSAARRPARKVHAFIQVECPQLSQRRAILQALHWLGNPSLISHAWPSLGLLHFPPHLPPSACPSQCQEMQPSPRSGYIRYNCTSRITCSSWPRAPAEPPPAQASPRCQRCSRRQIPGWRSEGWRTACQPSAWGRGGGGRRAGVMLPAAIPGWRSEGWRTACQPSAWGKE